MSVLAEAIMWIVVFIAIGMVVAALYPHPKREDDE